MAGYPPPESEYRRERRHDRLHHGEYPKDPKHLIPRLCSRFYELGWVTGTGGGMTIRDGDHLYLVPSGVQKEAVEPEDLFVFAKKAEHKRSRSGKTWGGAGRCYCAQLRSDVDESVHIHPNCSGETDEDFELVAQPLAQKGFRPSQCTPLFFNAYFMRSAGACIHTHSQHAVLATLICERLGSPGELRISHQEMIKGIRNDVTGEHLKYFDELVVPIIDNTPEERDLQTYMAEAMRNYPTTSAVLVRRHGVYVWGPDWVKAKTMCECYDYLFEMFVKMYQLGFATVVPATATIGGA